MKQTERIWPLTVTFCIMSILAWGQTQSAGDTIRYEVNPQEMRQHFEGWGVSLCWWAGQCGKWSDEKIDEIITWLVSPEGLNYSLFRYNIGGGDDPQNRHCTPHHMGQGKGLRAEMEEFLKYFGSDEPSSTDSPTDIDSWDQPQGFGLAKLKTCPSGFPKDWPYVNYLRLKDYCCWHAVSNSFFEGDNWLDEMERMCRAAKPMMDFINDVINDYL